MKLRTKYFLFVIIVHLTALVLSFYIFKQNILFIVSEVFILVSVWLSWSLYRQLLSPLKLLLQGVDAIRSRDFNVRFVPTGKYEMDQLIAVYNAMIDELRKERTKQEEQHLFLDKLIFTSPTGILILDHDEMITQINPRALQFLQLEQAQVVGRNLSGIAHPIFNPLSKLQSGESVTVSINGTSTFKMQKSHFMDRGFARQFVMIEELTVEMLAAEKKAYGKVIRMMAHEVNNTIGPVNSIVQSAIHSAELYGNETTPNLRNALQVAIDRNYNLNLFMRNFADVVRLPEPSVKKTNLSALIRDVVQLMEMKAFERSIIFKMVMPNENIFIHADPQQLEQVLINIIKNAMEAIGVEGTIMVSYCAPQRNLEIIDSGSGISENVAEQLFSPFFSTRKDGQGIGLTLVKEILVNHGFPFSLKTVQPGKTVFTIRV